MATRTGACLLVLLVSLCFCTGAHAWDAYVVRVEDGNTISVCERPDRDEPSVILRFYGIDAPSQRQPFGREARDFLLRLMPKGTKVSVDSVGADDQLTMNALVQVAGKSVNYQLLIEGLAWVNRLTCKAMFCRRWYIQEHQAVVNRRGLWGLNMSTPPWQWSR
ncbi:thermonuclease family protein [Desulfovibrio sp. SGI.169]|uniref:thermonuclease family protein n=1 Tax=Desulfovibrio sp. SGI.169 TaxID=3420561 RepID=UPI003D089C17